MSLLKGRIPDQQSDRSFRCVLWVSILTKDNVLYASKTNKSKCYMKILSFYLLSNEHLLLWETDLILPPPYFFSVLYKLSPQDFQRHMSWFCLCLMIRGGKLYFVIMGNCNGLSYICIFICLLQIRNIHKHSL